MPALLSSWAVGMAFAGEDCKMSMSSLDASFFFYFSFL